MDDVTAPVITALVALGMALAFIRADPASPTSRAFTLSLAFAGLSIIVNVFISRGLKYTDVPAWAGLLALTEAISFCAVFEWVLRVRRTIPASGLRTRFGDYALRIAQGLALLYGLLSVAMPERRIRGFIGALQDPDAIVDFDFYLFSIPLEVAMLLAMVSMLLALNRNPDRAERTRLISVAIGLPFAASGLVMPTSIAPVTSVIGLLIILVGAVRYHVMQGQRGMFLSRFLSPQVVQQVRHKGLRSVMQDTTVEISVVCCDLRNFTAFAQQCPSQKIMRLLREYYDAVGEVVRAFDGTIKDYAGDGILILVGAPLPLADHALRAVAMAESIRDCGTAVTRRWAQQDAHLGIGVGVASGQVTVGVVGGAQRLEYAAVGPAVNLACRLCELAGHAEILASAHTVELIHEGMTINGFSRRPPVNLKGVGDAVPYFAMTPACDAEIAAASA